MKKVNPGQDKDAHALWSPLRRAGWRTAADLLEVGDSGQFMQREMTMPERPDRPLVTDDKSERGAVIVFVALGLVVLIGMVGLAIDVGHAYTNKSQLQNIADASALAGASALNGTADGLDEAENRATDYAGAEQYLGNKTEFDTDVVSIPAENVTYSTALGGPWLSKSDAQATADTIRFVRVVVPPQPSAVLFARVVPGIPNVLNFGADAVAGKEPVTEVCKGLDPFSPIVLGNDENFGYEPGEIYSIRLSPGGSGHNCSDYGLPGSVTGNFGLADPSSRTPSLVVFVDNLLYGNYNNCVPVAANALDTTTGNMGNAAMTAMQDRYRQDTNTTGYPLSGVSADDYNIYLTSYQTDMPRTNHRRVLRVAFNDGTIPTGHSGQYNVVGYGCFWMSTLPSGTHPSDAICLMYVGSCDITGSPTGGNGASITKTVLFK